MDTPFTPGALAAHTDFMRRLCASLLGHEQDAEDLAQTVQLGILSAKGDATMLNRNWLARVLRRRSANALRERATRNYAERDAARPEAMRDPALMLERMELQQKLLAAVMALDEKYRQVIDLRYTEGLAPTEIASQLGVPVSTVKTWLQRAIASLRESLDQSSGGNRDSWCALLAPLAGEHWVPSSALPFLKPSALGALIMSTKMMWGVVALALGLGAYVAWVRPERGVQGPAKHELSMELPAPSGATKDAAPITVRLAVEPTPSRMPLAGPESAPEEACDWVLDGTLRDTQGNPVANGTLKLRLSSPYPWETEAQTIHCDGEGRYRLRLNAPSPQVSPHTHARHKLSVFASTPQHRPTHNQLELPELDRGSATPVEFDPRIEAGPCIRGRVLDSGGLPVAGASLMIGVDNLRSLDVGKTNAQGNYVIALPEQGSAMRLVAWHAGSGLAHSETWTANQRDVDLPDLQLRCAASLRGRLTFPDGVPIQNLPLRFSPLENQQSFSLSRFALPDHGAPGMNMGTVSTDAEGRFQVEGILPGTYALTTRDWPLATTEPVEVGEVTSGQFFETELALHWVRMVVVDEQGLPLPGADADMMQGLGGISARALGPAAAIEYWVAPGKWDLSAGFQGAQSAQSTLWVGETDYRNEVRLVLDFSGPMGRVQVQAQDANGTRLGPCGLKLARLISAKTKPVYQYIRLDGDALSPEIPAGDYHYVLSVSAASRGLAFETDAEGVIQVLDGQTVPLRATMAQAGRLALACTVSDGGPAYIGIELAEVATGKPLEHTILIKQNEEAGTTTYGALQPGEEGVSELLAPGLWNVRVYAIGYQDHLASVLIHAGRSTPLSVVLEKP